MQTNNGDAQLPPERLPKEGEVVLAWWGDNAYVADCRRGCWMRHMLQSDAEEGEIADTPPNQWVSLSHAKAAGQLAEVLAEWVDYFDELNEGLDPRDPVVKTRNQYHGARLAKSRAALASAGGEGK